jgi:AraC-like DNA-binding protein/cupin superfamily acireductone dioxygenase involved in methionine salvage
MEKYGYITIKTFQAIREHKFPLFIGENLLIISNLQLNIHKINSPTLPHSHPDNQIIYYIKGSGKEIIEKREYEIFPGTLVFIPKRKKHLFIPSPGTSAEIFTLRFEIIKNTISGFQKEEKKSLSILKFFYSKKPNLWVASFKRKNEIETFINKIKEILEKKGFGYLIALKGYILLLLREFLISITERKINKKLSIKDKIFMEITNYLKDHIDRKLTSKDVANLVGLSQNYLQKIVKTYTGYSFSRYFNEIKIDYAKKLLKETTLEIKEIAGKVGIYDFNYFSRLFRKIEGISPSKFRNSTLKD